MSNFITELKKRKVFNSAAIYLATAFVLLQVAQIVIPALHIPDWTLSFIVVLIILGFPVVLIFSWIYDVSDKGLVKTKTADIKVKGEAHPHEFSKSSAMGIVASIAITIGLVYMGIDFLTTEKQTGGKTSIAVLNFDNIRKFPEYDWLEERIASNLTYKLGQLTTIRMIDRLQILNKLGEIDPEKASVIDYKINQVAKNIDVNLILHGNFTIMDEIIEITAFFADTHSGDQISLMLEQYPLEELSDIPTQLAEKITTFINTHQRFKPTTK
jgi:TolB-like protein